MTTPDVAEQFRTGSWAFTPDVAGVFDDHVRASIPFYDAIQQLVAEAADWLLPSDGLIADLGASTGTTVAAIFNRHPERNLRAALYDEQPAMLTQATTRLTEPIAAGRVTIYARRIETEPLDHQDADLTTLLFTLQFLPWPTRIRVLASARKHAAQSGALIVAEKVRPLDVRWHEIATDASHDWKAAHGIAAEAIYAKARALRGVLTPYPLAALTTAIRDAGWHTPEILFRWHQWVVIGAFATPLDI